MENNSAKNSFDRARAFKIFAVVLLCVCILSLLYWFIFSRNTEYTDDAYVGGSQIQVISQIEGAISGVNISETQFAKEGQVLFKIDPTEVMIASEKADIDLQNAYLDYRKRQALKGDAAVSREELEHSKLTMLKAWANARQAYINLLRTEIQSPVNAIVAKRYAQIGQRVAPGTPLALLVGSNDIWVDANYKEGQLENIRVGQPVSLESDLYGSKHVFKGKVVGFAPGTGSTLALLPPQNATGNWVKVVQRLPVRIALDKDQLTQYPLNIGLSMNVKVDTSDQSGTPLSAMDSGPVEETSIYKLQYEKADQHIQKLISRY
jgi:membrane fusion protein, multidrug efflux system